MYSKKIIGTKMQILAHRGLWETKSEQNSLNSLKMAFDNGFGVETDIRDYENNLIISHDIPTNNPVYFEDLLKIYTQHPLRDSIYLALNIKSDGIQRMLKNILEKYDIKKYFVFDMSTPEMVQSRKLQLSFYTRQSDIESPVLYNESSGVWLDDFSGKWFPDEILKKHLEIKKNIAIVSEELHGRPCEEKWEYYKSFFISNPAKNQFIFLCTDRPYEANTFFNNSI